MFFKSTLPRFPISSLSGIFDASYKASQFLSVSKKKKIFLLQLLKFVSLYNAGEN